MRCLACDQPLTDFEDSRRGALSGALLSLCSRCLSDVGNTVATTEDWRLYDPKYDDLDTPLHGPVKDIRSDTYDDPEDDRGD